MRYEPLDKLPIVNIIWHFLPLVVVVSQSFWFAVRGRVALVINCYLIDFAPRTNNNNNNNNVGRFIYRPATGKWSVYTFLRFEVAGRSRNWVFCWTTIYYYYYYCRTNREFLSASTVSKFSIITNKLCLKTFRDGLSAGDTCLLFRVHRCGNQIQFAKFICFFFFFDSVCTRVDGTFAFKRYRDNLFQIFRSMHVCGQQFVRYTWETVFIIIVIIVYHVIDNCCINVTHFFFETLMVVSVNDTILYHF